MTKLLSVLLAGFFATGVFAQAVTTKSGDAMGPTTSTDAAKGGGSKSSGAVKGDKSSTGSAVTVAPGGAMGPTTTTDAAKGGGSASKTKRGDVINKEKDASVTIAPGGAMGPTGATTSGPKK